MAMHRLQLGLRALSHSALCRAGHNKWSKVKHIKAVTDAQKSKEASKISRSITSAVRSGGADPAFNVRLLAALNGAKAAGVAKSVVESAIARGLPNQDKSAGSQMQQTTYEAFLPAMGVALIVEASTDNVNRTVANVKSILKKYEASLSSVAYMFDHIGLVKVRAQPEDPPFERVFEAAVEAGAEDVEPAADAEEEIHVFADKDGIADVASELQNAKLHLLGMDMVFRPKADSAVQLKDDEQSQNLAKLVNALSELKGYRS